MAAEWLLSEVIIAIATPAFGHFEMVRPTSTRIVRWLANRPEPMEESNVPAALAGDHRGVRTVRPHRRAVAEPGLAGTDDQQAAHVNAARIQRFQTGDRQLLTVAADVAADDDRSLRRTEFEEQFVGSEDLLPPGTRGRVVDGEDQVGFRDCAQPLFDH